MIFGLTYGQDSAEGEEEDIRPGFKGEYERSITSNKLNEYSYDKKKTNSAEKFSWFLMLIMFIINVVIIYVFIYLMIVFDRDNLIETEKTYIALNVLVPTVILEFILVVEEVFFKKFALWSCEKANFKTNQEFE